MGRIIKFKDGLLLEVLYSILLRMTDQFKYLILPEDVAKTLNFNNLNENKEF